VAVTSSDGVVRRELVGDGVATTSSSTAWRWEGAHRRADDFIDERELFLAKVCSSVDAIKMVKADFGGAERGYDYNIFYFGRVIFFQDALQTCLCRVILKGMVVDSLS
jgi:hypothetical protein